MECRTHLVLEFLNDGRHNLEPLFADPKLSIVDFFGRNHVVLNEINETEVRVLGAVLKITMRVRVTNDRQSGQVV